MSVFPNSFSSKVLKEQFVAAFIMVYFQVYSGMVYYGIIIIEKNPQFLTVSIYNYNFTISLHFPSLVFGDTVEQDFGLCIAVLLQSYLC